MLDVLKKIFGAAAAPTTPATPPVSATQSMTQQLGAANLLPPKNIWNLIESGDLKGLQELVAADPSQLNATRQYAIRKRIHVYMKPVHYAAYAGREEALVLLHQNGADINETTKGGYTALHLAARSKTGGVAAAYLLEKGNIDINALSTHGTTALMEAARSGNETAVRVMLEKNPKTDTATPQSAAAICLAARNGHFNIVTRLAAHGADINVTDALLRTPLWHAVFERRGDIVDYLMQKGADTTGRDLQGSTLLMLAAQRANTCLMAQLLDAGHDPTEHDNNGNTALHYATYDDKDDNAKQAAALLLKHGAWIDATNKVDETPLAYAKSKGRTMASLVEYLAAAENDPATPRTPSLNDVFQEGAKREVKVMKALKLRAGPAHA